MPGEDGYWHKQYYNEDGTVADEITDNKWTDTIKKGVVCVVYDTENGYLQITNAEGMKEGQIINIPITSNLKSLAVIPYVLDKETNYPLAYFYNIMGYETKVEVGDATAKYVVASSTNAKVHYRLNPANANTKDWEWTMINRSVVTTRATGDANDLLSIKSTERVNDEFIVTLKSKKSLEDLENNNFYKEHAIAALQGTNKETAEVIASDYVKVSSADLKNFTVITGHDDMKVFELPTVYDLYEDVNSIKGRTPDTRMLYTGSLDLNTIVRTEATDLRNDNISPITPTLVEDLVDEGELTYEYSLPKEFLLGSNQTNQQDFVTLDGSILKVNTEKWPNGTGAIGTTPIVEVYALVNGKVIASGVLKVAIVEKDAVIKPDYVVTVDPVNIDYSDIKVNGIVNQFTWEDMRKVYDALGITREEFLNNYGEVNPLSGKLELNYTITDENGIEAVYNFVDGAGLYNWTDLTDGGEYTNAIEMVLNPAQIASNTTGTMKITYIPNDPYAYAPIVVKFPYTVYHKHPAEAFPEFNEQFVDKDQSLAIIKGQMINGVWTQKVEISEHFTGLETYKPLGNHSEPVLVLTDDIAFGARLDLDGSNLKDQVLTLNSEINGNELNVPVAIVEKLANGESYCIKSYTIRFVNPLRLTPAEIKLTAPFPGREDEKNITFVVKDTEGRTIITNGTVAANNIYGIAQDDVTVTYSEGEDWSVFGINNDNTQKLTLNENTPSIKWENKGTALAKPVNTTYKVQVLVKGIAIMTEEGAVTVTETDM